MGCVCSLSEAGVGHDGEGWGVQVKIGVSGVHTGYRGFLPWWWYSCGGMTKAVF